MQTACVHTNMNEPAARMSIKQDPENLEQLFKRVRYAEKDDDKVSLKAILDEVGHRSFGPLLLTAGLIISAPVIGDIPGVPVILGTFVFLTAGQLLLQRDHFWLPDWLLKRSADREKLNKGLDWLLPAGRFIDRLLKPRLRFLTKKAGIYAIAATCMFIAMLTPVMELIPFSAQVAGAAITAFGLAIIADDGLFAIIGFLISAGSFGVVLYGFL